MNNYPLSEFYDAVPGEITIGSAWDDSYIYFLVEWEDANHDASTNRNLWTYDGKKWEKKGHVKPNDGSPAANAINAKDEIFGSESEDRVFFMFPVRDIQRNFRADGLGCAAYCHANAELSAVTGMLGHIPTIEEYMEGIKDIDASSAEIYFARKFLSITFKKVIF